MSLLSEYLADNPLHYWRFADSGGVLAHDIGSAPRSLVTAVPTSASLGYSGVASNGGAAATAGSVVYFFRDSESHAPPWSMEIWYWSPYVTHSAAQALFDWGTTAAVGGLILLLTNGLIQANPPSGFRQSGAAPAIQAWHQVVLTNDGVNAFLYVDGVQQGAAIGGQSGAAATFPFTVGGDIAAGQLSDAFVAEAAFFPSALGAARVSAHFAASDVSGAPVYGGAGGLSGSGSGSAAYDGILQQILKSVRKIY